MKGFVEFVSKLLLRILAEQIWPPKRTNEEEVACKDSDRFHCAALHVKKHEAQMFRSMPRRVQCHELNAAYFDSVPVPEFPMLHQVAVVLTGFVSAQGKFGLYGLRKSSRSGRKISVDVRFRNELDREVLLRGVCGVAVK